MSADAKQIAMQKAWQNASQLAKAGIYAPMSPKFIDWFSQGWDAAVLEAAPASSAMAMQDKIDADRYRWLRDGNDVKGSTFAHTLAHNFYGMEWDAKIDAAIKQSQQSPVQASDAGRQG